MERMRRDDETNPLRGPDLIGRDIPYTQVYEGYKDLGRNRSRENTPEVVEQSRTMSGT